MDGRTDDRRRKGTPVRYSDGPGVTCEVHIARAPRQVWDLVTDIHLPTRLSPELQRVEWLDGAGQPGVGASFAGFNQHKYLGEWRSVSYVTEYRQPEVFAWLVTDPDGYFAGAQEPAATRERPAATWRYELLPEQGGTLLRQSMRMGPGRSGLSLLIDRAPEQEEQSVAARLDQLRMHVQITLDGIKELAERGD